MVRILYLIKYKTLQNSIIKDIITHRLNNLNHCNFFILFKQLVFQVTMIPTSRHCILFGIPTLCMIAMSVTSTKGGKLFYFFVITIVDFISKLYSLSIWL